MTPPLRLMNRNFLLLWQGQAVSQIGNQLAIVGMLFWIKQSTDSATLVGMILMASVLPSVVFGLFGGTIADRYSRRSIIVYSDLINGLIVLALSVFALTNPNEKGLILIGLFIVSSFVALVGSFFRPAVAASIPDIVPKGQVAKANSLNEASVQISTFIGFGLGGVLFQLLGGPVLFLFNGLSYLFSAMSELFISIPQSLPERGKTWKQALHEFQLDTVLGFRYVWMKPGMKFLFLAAAALNVLSVPVFVLLPFYVEDFLNVGANWYGFLMAAFGGGTLAGYGCVSVMTDLGNKRGAFILSMIIASSIVFIGLGILINPMITLVLMLMLGIAIGVVNVNVITLLQLTTPSQMRGRVFGLLGTLSQALSPVAMGLSGLVADWTGKNIPLIYMVCGVISFLMALSLAMKRELRVFLAYEVE